MLPDIKTDGTCPWCHNRLHAISDGDTFCYHCSKPIHVIPQIIRTRKEQAEAKHATH